MATSGEVNGVTGFQIGTDGEGLLDISEPARGRLDRRSPFLLSLGTSGGPVSHRNIATDRAGTQDQDRGKESRGMEMRSDVVFHRQYRPSIRSRDLRVIPGPRCLKQIDNPGFGCQQIVTTTITSTIAKIVWRRIET